MKRNRTRLEIDIMQENRNKLFVNRRNNLYTVVSYQTKKISTYM